jgi:DNA repair exonuclease SbcCD nuclease subunit
MGRVIRFIHTADLHLGSMLHIRNKVSGRLKDVFEMAIFNAFEKICSAAINLNVDFILISGDVYDREARSVKGNSFFVEQCRRLEVNNIKVFAIGGNHDPISINSELFQLPSNVYIMGSENADVVEIKDKDGRILYRIVGQSYKENWESRKMYKNYLLPKDDILNIALLHTQLDGNSSYVPCYPSDLAEMNSINYWALGHIHKLKLVSRTPVIVYPGIPQGRDQGEDGVGGALLVKAEENKIASIDFLETSEVIWKNMEIILRQGGEETINNISDLESFICEEFERLIINSPIPSEEINIASADHNTAKGYVVKLSINGRSELYHMLNDRDDEVSQYLLESLNNRFSSRKHFIYVDSMEINVGRPIENLEELKLKNSTLKEISTLAKMFVEDSEIKADIIKRLGSIWELNENYEDLNIKKLQLSEDLFTQIIQQAEQLAIEELHQRSEEM